MPRHSLGYFPYGDPDERFLFPEDHGIALVSEGGFSHHRQPILLPSHQHRGAEIHYVATGKLTQILETGETLTAQGGELVIVQAEVSHRGEHDILPKGHYLWCGLNPAHLTLADGLGFTAKEQQALHQAFAQLGNRVVRANKHVHAQYDAIIDSLLAQEAHGDNDPFALARFRSALTGFILATIESFTTEAQEADISDSTKAALDIMNKTVDLSMSELARKINMTESMFYKTFKEDMGITPAEHHLRLRCERARELLLNDLESPIANIAEQCGFPSARHFSTVFKRLYGHTPSAFRNQQQ